MKSLVGIGIGTLAVAGLFALDRDILGERARGVLLAVIIVGVIVFNILVPEDDDGFDGDDGDD